jgi:hypothetical protein
MEWILYKTICGRIWLLAVTAAATIATVASHTKRTKHASD